MNKEDYVEEIALMVVEKLVELNKNQNLDLVELLKNNVSVQVIPVNTIEKADENVPDEEDDFDEIMDLQKEIIERVLVELQKKENPVLLN